MSDTLVTSMLAVITVQGVMQVIALLNAKKSNQKANKIMSCFIGLAIFQAAYSYLLITDQFHLFPDAVSVIPPTYFLLGVLPFLYTQSLINPDFKIRGKSLLHFIPLLINVLVYIPVYTSSAEDKVLYVTQNQDVLLRKVLMLCVFVFNFSYHVISYLKLRSYHKQIKNFYSNLSALQLGWLEKLFLLIILLNFLGFPVSLFFENSDFKSIHLALMSCFLIFILFSGYMAIRQIDPLFHMITGHNKKLSEVKKNSKKNITEKVKNEVKIALDTLFEDQSVYLDSELNLNSLAKKLGFPAYIVSNVINSEHKVNFFEFINSYRIEEAGKRLLDKQYQHLTIIAIAEDVGFNSKSTFNTAFKKYKNVTPSQFRSMNT